MQLGNPLERIYGGGDVYEAAMLLVIGIQHITCPGPMQTSRWSLNNANQVYRKVSFGQGRANVCHIKRFGVHLVHKRTFISYGFSRLNSL